MMKKSQAKKVSEIKREGHRWNAHFYFYNSRYSILFHVDTVELRSSTIGTLSRQLFNRLAQKSSAVKHRSIDNPAQQLMIAAKNDIEMPQLKMLDGC